MNYTLHQLRIFLKVARTLSITKTAEELHLTQPAISIQLKNFQEQFDIPLIEVINKKVFVTEFGKKIAESAEKILFEVHAIRDTMDAHRGLLTGTLKISAVSTGKYIAPYFIVGFMKQHPGVELVLDVTNKSRVVTSLERNEVDFSLVTVRPAHLQLESIELMQNKLFVVGNCEKQFKKKEYDKRIFEQIPLIYREQGSGNRLVMEKYIAKNKLPVKKKMELTSNEAVKQAVIAGLGYSIMPLIGIKNELRSKLLQIIPVKGFPITSTWSLIWLKGKTHSPVAAAFHRYIQSEKENIIRNSFDWITKH